ncbi:MAG: penicillin-binding transpeptidase domain-containing protein [Gammaproteobacteria bacterium]|nr:penicillin-binding transpeptidase domain-containing protein [Gammaproteobacteria bacterium]
MLKKFISLVLMLLITNCHAAKSTCFILYDLTTNKVLMRENAKQCQMRFSPCSTFKIPLALMAFDQGIFKDENIKIKWDGVARENSNWNKNQTPKTWLQYSTIWVSQLITQQLGEDKIKYYLEKFHYGNTDISGGITKFWLSSSLKISADEELIFLKHLWKNQLAVSPTAIALTKKLLPVEKTVNNNTFYEKAGTGFLNGENANNGVIGWFVGFLTTKKHDYVFVTISIDYPSSKVSSGLKAKEITENNLRQMQLW